MATTPTYINQRINNLQAQINSIISGGGGGVPTSSDLADVLDNGNSAGTFDVNMNSNDIINADSITATTNLNLNGADVIVTATNDLMSNCGNTFQVTAAAGVNLFGDSLQLTSNTNGIGLNSNVQIALTALEYIGLNAVTDDITLNAGVGLKSINLDGANVNSFSRALGISFTANASDSFSYNFNGTGVPQTYETVYTLPFTIPVEFLALSPPPTAYSTPYWKIDFALNTWNNSNIGDKGIAVYFYLEDNATNQYAPICYNDATPYAVYQPSSNFTSATSGNSAFQNFNWTDYINLQNYYGTNDGAIYLKLVFAADNAFTGRFQLIMTLTRTNLV